MIEFKRTTLDTCARDATGLVVVIDVLRAFSTAAFAFAAGAKDIVLVSTVEEALALRKRMGGSLVMGEVGGLPVDGFDFSNSPAEITGLDLSGRRLIQRTSAGTQGIVFSQAADVLLASSFVCAEATVRLIQKIAPATLSFVLTGVRPGGGGEEDAACADYLETRVRGGNPDPQAYLQRVRTSYHGRIFADPTRPELPAADLELCLQLDRFTFAMQVEPRDGLFLMQAIPT